MSLLQVENHVETREDEGSGKEQSENYGHQTSFAKKVCIEVVDEIRDSEKNHKNSEFFHRLNIERIV